MTPVQPPTERSPLLPSQNQHTAPSPNVHDNDDSSPPIPTTRDEQYRGNPEIASQLKYILPATSIGVFLAAADQTIIVSSYGKIGSDLHALNLTSWIATSYFLTLTSFQPLYGKLSDVFGRKTCLLIAYAIFGSGCLFCGSARNINELIAARIWQGIGGGGMTTVVNILMSDIIPLKDRGVWQGIINIVYAAGLGSGAPLGGFLADIGGWRWSFLAQVPFCVCAFLAVAVVLKLPAPEKQDWREKLGRIDYLGAVVLVVAVASLIFGMDRGSNVSWEIPLTYVPLIVSAFAFPAFVFVEMKVAKEPFAPGHIVFPRTMLACYACNYFAFGASISLQFYIPLLFQAAHGETATDSAIRLLPAVIASVTGSLFAGFVMRRTGKFYWLTVIAYSLIPVGISMVLLFSDRAHFSTAGIAVGLGVGGFGNGIGVTSSLIALISTAAPEDQAVTTACSYLFRSLGSVMGIAISATIVQQRLRIALKKSLGSGDEAAKLEKGVRASLDFLKSLPIDVQKLVRDSYSDAVRNGFLFMLVLACGAMISSIFIKEKKLSR
jgi:MFS family permease